MRPRQPEDFALLLASALACSVLAASGAAAQSLVAIAGAPARSGYAPSPRQNAGVAPTPVARPGESERDEAQPPETVPDTGAPPRLSGVVVAHDGRTALFADDESGVFSSVQEGGKVGDFLVESITAQQVVLVGKSKRRLACTVQSAAAFSAQSAAEVLRAKTIVTEDASPQVWPHADISESATRHTNRYAVNGGSPPARTRHGEGRQPGS